MVVLLASFALLFYVPVVSDRAGLGWISLQNTTCRTCGFCCRDQLSKYDFCVTYLNRLQNIAFAIFQSPENLFGKRLKSPGWFLERRLDATRFGGPRTASFRATRSPALSLEGGRLLPLSFFPSLCPERSITIFQKYCYITIFQKYFSRRIYACDL